VSPEQNEFNLSSSYVDTPSAPAHCRGISEEQLFQQIVSRCCHLFGVCDAVKKSASGLPLPTIARYNRNQAMQRSLMRVYRFMSLANGLDSIQQRRLRIGRLFELNDPYDCAPGIANAPNVPTGEEEAFETGYFARFGEAFGLLSYSATVSDPIIWSHYADSHRGIAFQFDYTDPSDGLIEVEYGTERRIFDYNELEQIRKKNAEDEIHHVISSGFTKKASSWRYEQEYRQFISLNSCTPVGEYYFRPIPSERLTGVILGARCRIRPIDVARSLQSAGFPDVSIVRSCKKHPSHYEMVVV
jgi:hypothetical protein